MAAHTDVADATTIAIPVCCPFCRAETLTPTQGSSFAEFDCWDGREYCWEGELSGYSCESCKHDFFLEPSFDEIHEGCECSNGRCDNGKDCVAYIEFQRQKKDTPT